MLVLSFSTQIQAKNSWSGQYTRTMTPSRWLSGMHENLTFFIWALLGSCWMLGQVAPNRLLASAAFTLSIDVASCMSQTQVRSA